MELFFLSKHRSCTLAAGYFLEKEFAWTYLVFNTGYSEIETESAQDWKIAPRNWFFPADLVRPMNTNSRDVGSGNGG